MSPTISDGFLNLIDERDPRGGGVKPWPTILEPGGNRWWEIGDVVGGRENLPKEYRLEGRCRGCRARRGTRNRIYGSTRPSVGAFSSAMPISSLCKLQSLFPFFPSSDFGELYVQ